VNKKLSKLKYYRAYEHTHPDSVLVRSRYQIYYLHRKMNCKCILYITRTVQ